MWHRIMNYKSFFINVIHNSLDFLPRARVVETVGALCGLKLPWELITPYIGLGVAATCFKPCFLTDSFTRFYHWHFSDVCFYERIMIYKQLHS